MLKPALVSFVVAVVVILVGAAAKISLIKDCGAVLLVVATGLVVVARSEIDQRHG